MVAGHRHSISLSGCATKRLRTHVGRQEIFFPTKSDWKWVRFGRNSGNGGRIGDHEVSTFLIQ